MNFLERFLDPQQFESGGLTRRLESLLPEQAGYRPETGFAGWPQAGAMAGREAGAPRGLQPTAPQSGPATPADQPTAYPARPIPAPRPPDVSSGSIAIGNYMMPQIGRPPVS